MPHPITPQGGRKAQPDRPKKPYPDFPLSPHASGAWQKKIRGKIYYFGKWGRRVDGVLVRVPGDGWEAALEEYKAVADDLHAGNTPRPRSGGLTVAGLSNHFLTAKQRQLTAGELSPRMFAEYKSTTDRLVSRFGKNRVVSDLIADDFDGLRAGLAEQFGPVRLGNEIQRVRTVFKYGFEAGLIDSPVRYGPQFKKPSRKVMRVHKATAGERVFAAAEVRRLVDAAGVPLRAMILLGVNCGFGNSDCGRLPLSAMDLDRGWVSFHRPKTGISRRCPLWPETVTTLRDALAARPEPKAEADAGLVFVTRFGGTWVSAGSNAVALETGKLLRKLGLARPGVGFYSLRHSFRTAADGAKDVNAVRLIMGHADDSIEAGYTHGIADDRLRAVSDHVRAWLFGSGNGAG